MSNTSPGVVIIVVMACLSSVALWAWPTADRPGQPFWLFSKGYAGMYAPDIEKWNHAHPDPQQQIKTLVISIPALERRLLSGFLSGTPVPEAVEVEANMAGKFFSGPLDAVGFVDLTERIREEGLLEEINGPSFTPWTNRGRIFGLPHDVHPVLLAYRADLVEAAGIDMSRIETWEDFARELAPLMQDGDGDGYPDRYLLSIWETDTPALEVLIRQAGGRFFDANGEPALDSATNAKVLAQVVSWTAGPDRIALHAPEFSAEGNHLFLSGKVLCTLMPDWLSGIWMEDLPGLAGKVKLMPLPAWEPGGRRTSVRGGTMLAIPKTSADPELAWEFAKQLYLSPEVARRLYRENGTISPVKAMWADPVYDEPSAYFSGQAIGRLYVEAAPDVPPRTSSPYKVQAEALITDAAIRLKRRAEQAKVFEAAKLEAWATEELRSGQEELKRRMEANAFLSATAEGGTR